MSFTARAKRVLVGALTGAMVLSLMPAGMASAGVEEVCENATSPFTDKGTTHADAIDCIYSYGITTGKDATTFGTFEDLTRGQAATLFVEFALVATDGAIADAIDPDIEVPFTDIEGNTHQANIEILYRLGLIQGTSETTYEPGEQILRAQFAEILFGAHEALEVPFEDEYPNPFTDVDRFSVSALTAEGIFSGTAEEGIFDPWAPVLRGQTASTLALSAGLLDDLGLWLAPRLPEPEGDVAESFLDAPELVDVQFVDDNDTRTQLNFVFDEPVQPEFVSAQTFYMIAWNGAQIFAEVQDLRRLDEVVPGGADNIVRAAFLKAGPRYLNAVSPDLGGQFQFGTTPRGYEDIVGAGVVADAVIGVETELNNPPRSLPLQGSDVDGDFAYAPYITDVEVSAPDNSVALEMSQGVTLTDANNATTTAITLWFNDNRGFDYQDGANVGPNDPAARRVARSFAYTQADLAASGPVTTLELEDLIGNLSTSDAANLARVTIEPGVFQGANGAQNTLQSIDVATGTNGVTPDPDLIGYELDPETDRVTFVFSETITDQVTIRDTEDEDESQVFNGVPEFFQVHHVSSEHRADLAEQPWVAFPGDGARHPDPNGTLYGGIDYSGVVRGQNILSTEGNEAVVQFPVGSITKDITRVSVVSWLDAPAFEELDAIAIAPQLVDFATADQAIRDNVFPRFGRLGVTVGDDLVTVGIAELAGKLDDYVTSGELSARGYGAVYATDGSGAPNVRMSIATPQSFEPLETIAPDPVGGSWDVVQRDNVDDSPQRYRITLEFDAWVAACDGRADILDPVLDVRNRRNIQNAALTAPSGEGMILSLWEEDGSRTTVSCTELTADNFAVAGNTVTFWAGNNPQTDVFTLNEVVDADLLTIEFGSVDSGSNYDLTTRADGVVQGKPGLRNFGQALPVVTE